MDQIQKDLLATVADIHEVPEGAYNIRANGQLGGRNTTANIDIVTKEDKPGIDIIIKPGQTKNVKFIVKGKTTWWNYKDFTVRYYFAYNGQKYLGSVWDDNSAFKRGKSWYNTYYYTIDEAHFLGYDWI